MSDATPAHPERSGGEAAAESKGPSKLRSALDTLTLHLLNPLVSIELAGAFRRKRFLAAFSITLLVVVAILTIVLVASLDRAILFPSKIGQNIFLAFNITLLIAMALLFPAFASVSIVEERVNRSLDMLLTTRMAPWEVFFGKWAASFVYSTTYLAGTLPVVGLAFLLGGVEPQALVTLALLATGLAAAVASIGTFASAATGSLLRAVLASYFLSLLFGFGLVMASMPVFFRHIALSAGILDAADLVFFDGWFVEGGDLIYATTALLYLGTTLFFAIVGTNRLAPPSHDRSTRVRGFLLLLMGALGVIVAAGLRRINHAGGGTPDADVLGVAVAAMIVGAVLLFFVTLVFSTEPAALSRRVTAELARRLRFSPMRLLAPGPTRGALFSIALAGAFLLGLAYDGRHGIGFGDSNSARICDRGDLAITDLGWLLFSFVAFLAALGRLLAVRAKGVVLPRVIVVGATIVCLFAPLLAFAAERSGSRRGRDDAPPQFPSTSLTGGYVLSPIMGGIGVFEVKTSGWWRGAYFVFPERLRMPAAIEEHLGRGGVYEDNEYEDPSVRSNLVELEEVLPPDAFVSVPAPDRATPAGAAAPTRAAAAGATTGAAATTATAGMPVTATAAVASPAPQPPRPIPYSRSRAARREAAALPLHKASTGLYIGLALVLWVAGSLLERFSRREAA